MGNKRVLKIFYFVLFVLVAAISCWATSHSLHLLWHHWPMWCIWGLTIAFFVIASYATKMIVDALNQHVSVSNRKGKLVGGIILLIMFWLFASMPTNTHTFFYNQQIGHTVEEDIKVTTEYLAQIRDQSVIDSAFFTVRDSVYYWKGIMTDNFNGLGSSAGHRGNGQYVQQCLLNAGKHMGCNIPVDPHYNSTDPSIINKYNAAIERELRKVEYRDYRVDDASADKASEIIEDLQVCSDTITKMLQVGDNSEVVMRQVEGVLSEGYSQIKTNARFVKFNSQEDKELYTRTNLETRTKRMLSVIDVWIDFVNGEYPLSFIFWVLLSILVDIAAFIFFDLTFKKSDDEL